MMANTYLVFIQIPFKAVPISTKIVNELCIIVIAIPQKGLAESNCQGWSSYSFSILSDKNQAP